MRRWTQDLEDSPFERLLSEVSTAVELEPEAGGTRVTLELHQRLIGGHAAPALDGIADMA